MEDNNKVSEKANVQNYAFVKNNSEIGRFKEYLKTEFNG